MVKLWQRLGKHTDENISLVLFAVIVIGLYPPYEVLIYKFIIKLFLMPQGFDFKIIITLVLLGLYRILLIPLVSYYKRSSDVIGDKLQVFLQHKLIKYSMIQPLRWRDSAIGDALLTKSLDAIKQDLPKKIVHCSLDLAKSIVTISLYLCLIYPLGWSILGLICAILVLEGIAIYIGQTASDKQESQNKEVTNLRNTLYDLKNQKEIHVYQGYGYLINRWNSLLCYSKNSKLTGLRWNLSKATVFMFSSVVLTVFLVISSARATISGILTLVDLLVLVIIFLRLYSEVPVLVGRFSEFMKVQPRCLVLFTIAEKQLDIKEEKMNTPKKVKRGFEFRNVGFTYPNLENLVLQDISFTINPGETVAIVGENGAGKSTLAKLMLGLYPPTTGQVLLDGTPLTKSQQMSAVFQDYMCYHLSVRENIGFGDLPNLSDDESIFRAAEKAGALEIIQRKRLRLEDTLGDFTGSTNLSGGEWQSMAIARGFMGDKEILLIDEPTASLDPFREIKLISKYLEHAANKITIIISHRLLVASLVDKVLVLKDGKLIEIGTHSDLLHEKGYYWSLWHNQARWYHDREEASDE